MTFSFYLGGYGRNSYRLTLHNNELRCSEYYGVPPDFDKVISVEGNKQWNQLMIFLKGCDWKRRYDSSILDGTQWDLKVRGEGVHITSHGSNTYPENFGEFLALLNKLVGVKGLHIQL